MSIHPVQPFGSGHACHLAARRGDAFTAVAEHYLTSPPTSEPAASGADRYQVVVHVSGDAVRKVPAGTSAVHCKPAAILQRERMKKQTEDTGDAQGAEHAPVQLEQCHERTCRDGGRHVIQ